MAAPEGVFLDAAHEILVDAIGSRLHDGLREPCEMSVADFDEVKYKLVVLSESTHVVTLNIAMPCAAALKTLGLAKTLSDTYPGMETTPEDGFDVAVQLDLNNVTDATATLSKLTLLRRNLIGTPFTQSFKSLTGVGAGSLSLMTLPWRRNESVFLCPGADPAKPGVLDRVIVVFSFDFVEESDKAFARIFLQQFVEVQRKVNNAPPCQFSESTNPPTEVRGAALPSGDIVGYLSLTIFKSHVDSPDKLEKVVTNLVGLRNYLQYHIKASKTYLHMRMRRKVSSWLQVLNRAVMTGDVEKEKKTASGKTFTRK